jgi:hypothetical protein
MPSLTAPQAGPAPSLQLPDDLVLTPTDAQQQATPATPVALGLPIPAAVRQLLLSHVEYMSASTRQHVRAHCCKPRGVLSIVTCSWCA